MRKCCHGLDKKKGMGGHGWVVRVRRVSFIMRGTRRYDNQSLLYNNIHHQVSTKLLCVCMRLRG